MVNSKYDFFDIGTARLAHLQVQKRMEAMIKKGIHVAETGDHTSGALGTWLYRVGLPQFNHMSEVVKLEEVHREFHNKSDDIIRYLRKRDAYGAEQAYTELKKLSEDIIILLTEIELRMMNKFIFIDSVRHPFRTIKRMIFQ